MVNLKKKIIYKTLFIMIFVVSQFRFIFADEGLDKIINKQINSLELENTQKVIEEIKLEGSNPYLQQFSIKETMFNSIKGNENITPIKVISGLINLILGQVNGYFNLMGRLMILAIFCTLLSTLSISFQNKSISQIAFYVCYIVLIITLTESFLISMEVTRITIDQMTMTMHASIPVMVTLLISTGNMASSNIFQPFIISSIQIATVLLKNAILPLVFFVSVLEIVSHMSEDFKITKLVNLVYLSIQWLLKGIVILFVSIMTLHGLTTPFVDGMFNKAAKNMMSTFVPVVGEALSGTVDLVMNCGMIVKNSYTVGIIIALLLICIVPLIKVILYMVVYQLTAAIIEPISDKRIGQCIAGMGRATGYLLGTLSTVMVLFILNMLILVGASNITTIMR